jgi:serine/threonine protein kinase
MHRDIKPFNVLINPETEQLKLIDFGLSDYFIPEKESNEHVASLYYKAPELMFGDTRYDYRVDVWAAGMIMAGMVPFISCRFLRRLLLLWAMIVLIKYSKYRNCLEYKKW